MNGASPSSINDVLDGLLSIVRKSNWKLKIYRQNESSKEVFFYPFVENPESLKLVPFYGEMPMHLIHQPTLTVPINCAEFERPNLKEELQKLTLKCWASVPVDELGFASIAMDFSNVIFGVRKVMSRNPRPSEFSAPKENEDYEFSSGKELSLYSMGHHHLSTSDDRLLQLLSECGAVVKDVKSVPESITVRLRSSVTYSTRHRLRLNSLLDFLSWDIQEWDPMKCHLVSTHRTGFGILLRSRVRQHITREELETNGITLPDFLTLPDLGGFLVRRGTNFESRKGSRVRNVYRILGGKTYELELDGVSFKLETISWSEHRFMAQNTFSFLVAQGSCKSQLSFPMTNDSQKMREIISRISFRYLRAIHDDSLSLLPATFKIPVPSGVPSIDSLALQSLRRLQFEQGDIHRLLGIPNNSSTTATKLNCQLVLRLLDRYTPVFLSSFSIRAREIEGKLKQAAEKVGILLDRKERRRDENERRSTCQWRESRWNPRNSVPLWRRRNQ